MNIQLPTVHFVIGRKQNHLARALSWTSRFHTISFRLRPLRKFSA